MNAAALPAGILVREAAISAVINAAISAGFFFAMFGLAAPVPVWGVGMFAFDFLPQSFAVTFFASFVPALVVRKAFAANAGAPGVRQLLGTSALRGLLAAGVGLVIWAGLFWLTGLEILPALTAFIIKVTYGFLLGGTVTYLTLPRVYRSMP